jgi:putative redox protein
MTETDPNLRHAELEWQDGLIFTGGAPGGPTLLIDGDNGEGPGPMVTLLLAAGACSGADIVLILEKSKVKLRKFRIEVTGRRNVENPRRYNALTLRFHLSGEGLTETNAQRAVDLSVNKYCSVLQSLNPDIPIGTEIIIS